MQWLHWEEGLKEILVHVQACLDFDFWPRHLCSVHEKHTNVFFCFFFLPCESKTNNNIILPQTFPSSCESQISCESWKGASGSSPTCMLCVHTHPHYTPWNYPVSILTPPSQRGRGKVRAQNEEVGTSFILEENHLSYWEVILRLVQWETSRVTVWMPITFCCDVPSITVMANISCVNTIGRYCTS